MADLNQVKDDLQTIQMDLGQIEGELETVRLQIKAQLTQLKMKIDVVKDNKLRVDNALAIVCEALEEQGP